MLRWKVQQLPNWDWDKYRNEVSEFLPMRWWAIKHITANPRDIALSYAPFTNAKLQYVSFVILVSSRTLPATEIKLIAMSIRQRVARVASKKGNAEKEEGKGEKPFITTKKRPKQIRSKRAKTSKAKGAGARKTRLSLPSVR